MKTVLLQTAKAIALNELNHKSMTVRILFDSSSQSVLMLQREFVKD